MSPAPRVLVISHMYPSRREPTAGIFIHQHVLALREAGADVQVLAPQPWAPGFLAFHPRWRRYGEVFRQGDLPEAPCQRVAYARAPGRAGNALAGPALAAALLPRLAWLRRGFPFDLLHAHTLTPDGLAALAVARALGVPVACTARGSDLHTQPFESRARLAECRAVVRRVDALLTVSEALASVARSLGGPRVRPRVIYNGVDPTRFRPADDRAAARRKMGLPEAGVLALFVGRVEAEKGAAELFEAFRDVAAARADLHLVVVGEGPLLEPARAELARAGLGARLHAPGRLPHEAIAGCMQAADLLLLPSWAEGMPNVVLEAMSTGLPCLVTPAGGVTEAVQDGYNGRVVPLRDARALASALADLAGSAAARRELGEAALRTARTRFSWTANAAAHLALYGEMLAP